MDIISMCLSAHRRFPFGSSNEQNRLVAYEIINKAFQFAYHLGIKNIQLAGYDVYYEESTEHSKALFEEGLRYTARLAEKYQIMASIEIMDTYFLGTIERAIPYIELIDSPYLKIYPDLGNLTQWSNNPSNELKAYKNEIVAIHLKDTKPNVFKCVPFGEGTVQFTQLFKTLKEINYQGPFVVEMWADNSMDESQDACIKRMIDAKNWLLERM